MHYHFTDKEREELASSLTVLHDTREQENGHILAWLDGQGIPHHRRSLETGDYSIMLPACPGLGFFRKTYFAAAIERKGSVDELVETLKDRTRFENECIRGRQLDFFALLVEDADGFGKIVRGDYRSQYNPKALLASLTAFSHRYGFPVIYLAPDLSARWIHENLYRHALEGLRHPHKECASG
ncbi:MAG: ERCC4 domain-containing protein [Bacillota bacterium]|jgi:ERCC4-type nuclease